MILYMIQRHASGRRWPVLRLEGGIWNFCGGKVKPDPTQVFLILDMQEKICYNIKKRLLQAARGYKGGKIKKPKIRIKILDRDRRLIIILSHYNYIIFLIICQEKIN